MNPKLKKQKQIKYKVVKANSRYSCMVHGSSLYGLKYDIDTEVHARPETLGVMCFRTYTDAYRLIHQHYYYRDHCIVIKVIPMGRGKIPHVLGSPQRLKDFYSGVEWNPRRLIPPDGTICYPAVYVIN